MTAGTSTRGALHRIVSWVKQEGEVKALDRLLVFALPHLLGAGILGLNAIDSTTDTSPKCLDGVRAAAQKVVGKTCPF